MSCRHLHTFSSRSAEKYLLLEIEKKKVKPIKKEYTGPMIRYHSVRMPLIEEVPVVEPPTPIQGDMRLDDIQVSPGQRFLTAAELWKGGGWW